MARYQRSSQWRCYTSTWKGGGEREGGEERVGWASREVHGKST